MRLASSILLALTSCASGWTRISEDAPTVVAGLRDLPVASSGAAGPIYLDGTAWTVSTEPPPGHAAAPDSVNQIGSEAFAGSSPAGGAVRIPDSGANITVAATVPGDLITDLARAGVIPDPWLDTTWIRNSSLWSGRPWYYRRTFTIDGVAGVLSGASSLLLVFDGVKMGATIRVNGVTVGVVRDQFLRYIFVLDAVGTRLAAGAGANRLDVVFGVGDVAEDGRFMACSGGWDWAP